jgi:hypothetical protein
MDYREIIEWALDAEPGDVFTDWVAPLRFVRIERDVDSRRWADIHLAVFETPGQNMQAALCGLLFAQGSTELQEDIDWFDYTTPEILPVVEREVIKYEVGRGH